MNPLVEEWLRIVHQEAIEIPVRMLVSGRIVEGLLTPQQRYELWERQVTSQAVLGDGYFHLPSHEVGPVSAEGAERIRAGWPDLEKRLAAEGGGFTSFYVREAALLGDGSQAIARFPVLVVMARAVTAFSLGGGEALEPPSTGE